MYKNEAKTFYETNSLPLSATLICLNIPLDSLRKDPDGKFVFIFPHTGSLNQILESFWKKSLVVEPNSYWEALRFVKSRMYA